jgi:hypothetical protein
MKKLQSDQQHFEQLQSLSQDPDVQHYLEAKSSQTPLEKAIFEWLATLSLFYGVPFVNLVPDERMLPVESIRFFYIDPNWIDSMLDGAMSIVSHGTRDDLVQLIKTADCREGADAQRIRIRPRLFKQTVPEDTPTGGTMTGFLMRSQVVAGWPGLEVKAFWDPDATSEIKPLLRIDRPSPDVLLVLIPGVPALIRISEPPEGLRFGVVVNPAQKPTSKYLVAQRGLGLEVDGQVAYQAGKQITKTAADWAEVPIRDGTERVLDVVGLQKNLRAKLVAAKALNASAQNLTPAEFGVQMVKLPERQAYQSGLVEAMEPVAKPRASIRSMPDTKRLFNKLFEE